MTIIPHHIRRHPIISVGGETMTSLVARLRLTNGANPLADRDWIAKVACTADNPTGQTDIDMPQTLRRLFGHTDFGVFAEVVTGGTITTGDKVTL